MHEGWKKCSTKTFTLSCRSGCRINDKNWLGKRFKFRSHGIEHIMLFSWKSELSYVVGWILWFWGWRMLHAERYITLTFHLSMHGIWKKWKWRQRQMMFMANPSSSIDNIHANCSISVRVTHKNTLRFIIKKKTLQMLFTLYLAAAADFRTFSAWPSSVVVVVAAAAKVRSHISVHDEDH